MGLSVLLSVYIKEKPAYLRACFESLLAQTRQADQVVLVEDGPLTMELQQTIEYYAALLPVQRVRLECNQGLARALNHGLQHCEHGLVARMDTDDVALPQRFERQLCYMAAHPEVDVASAWIEERNQGMEQVFHLKKLPERHEQLCDFAKKRSPLSHPVTIFRKQAVLDVGGYPQVFPEDYALWSLMLVKGYRFGNIPEVLLYMRTDNDFIGRRGLDFFKGEIRLLGYQRAVGFLSPAQYWLNLCLRAAIRLPPAVIRRFLYRFLR